MSDCGCGSNDGCCGSTNDKKPDFTITVEQVEASGEDGEREPYTVNIRTGRSLDPIEFLDLIKTTRDGLMQIAEQFGQSCGLTVDEVHEAMNGE